MNPESRIEERRQFGILYRHFLARVIDLELLSASGEIRNLLFQLGALLAAYSFVLAVFTVSHFAVSSASPSARAVSAWGVEEFLISTTLTVAGLFAVLAWNAVLPDRRDSIILDTLPLRTRTVFGAKTAAIAVALGLSVIAVNVFTGIGLPFAGISPTEGAGGAIRAFLAYWTTTIAAGGFVFASVFSVQSAAVSLFTYRFFQRISGLLQLLAFFAILALFFLTPPLANPAGVNSAANQYLLAWLPSFWFLGLFQELNGTSYPAFAHLAARAGWSLAAVCVFSFITGALTYRRTIRRIIEQPDISPGTSSGVISKFASAFTLRVLADPIDRAILLFSARTLARSRQHRLMFALYLGLAFAISLAHAKSLMYGVSDRPWDQPDTPLLIASLVTLFLGIVGSRAIFALPFALGANWIFRITAVRSPATYFSAVRKSLFAIAAAPVLFGSAILYLAIWPRRPALQHLLVLVLFSILLIQVSLRKFRKIPFACSYLPGKSDLRIKLGIAGFLFLLAVETGANLEYWSLQKPARYAAMLAFLIAAAFSVIRRTAAFAGSPHNRVQFEDVAAADIYALNLDRDAEHLNDDGYLDAVSAPVRRSFVSTIKRYVCCSVVLVAGGFSYERLGGWRDHQKFPQVGRSVDIGGRSLNIYCSGLGSPTVVMDSGGGQPGYDWKLVEPGAARLTRACWYDRAGYGWSDPAPHARTAWDIAGDLHKLLHAAAIPPPYVLVGHSLGGFHIRVFAARYPNEVSGMVLADSADEYEDSSRLPKSMQSPIRYVPKPLVPMIAQMLRFGIYMGTRRLLDNGVTRPDGRLSLHDTLVMHSLQLQPKAFDASLNEGLARHETLAQVKAVQSLGRIPLLVLSGAKKPAVALDDDFEATLLDQFMDYRVHVTQARLATLSTRGRQIILQETGHGVPTEAPEAVVDAVRAVLREQ